MPPKREPKSNMAPAGQTDRKTRSQTAAANESSNDAPVEPPARRKRTQRMGNVEEKDEEDEDEAGEADKPSPKKKQRTPEKSKTITPLAEGKEKAGKRKTKKTPADTGTDPAQQDAAPITQAAAVAPHVTTSGPNLNHLNHQMRAADSLRQLLQRASVIGGTNQQPVDTENGHPRQLTVSSLGSHNGTESGRADGPRCDRGVPEPDLLSNDPIQQGGPLPGWRAEALPINTNVRKASSTVTTPEQPFPLAEEILSIVRNAGDGGIPVETIEEWARTRIAHLNNPARPKQREEFMRRLNSVAEMDHRASRLIVRGTRRAIGGRDGHIMGQLVDQARETLDSGGSIQLGRDLWTIYNNGVQTGGLDECLFNENPDAVRARREREAELQTKNARAAKGTKEERLAIEKAQQQAIEALALLQSTASPTSQVGASQARNEQRAIPRDVRPMQTRQQAQPSQTNSLHRMRPVVHDSDDEQDQAQQQGPTALQAYLADLSPGSRKRADERIAQTKKRGRIMTDSVMIRFLQHEGTPPRRITRSNAARQRADEAEQRQDEVNQGASDGRRHATSRDGSRSISSDPNNRNDRNPHALVEGQRNDEGHPRHGQPLQQSGSTSTAMRRIHHGDVDADLFERDHLRREGLLQEDPVPASDDDSPARRDWQLLEQMQQEHTLLELQSQQIDSYLAPLTPRFRGELQENIRDMSIGDRYNYLSSLFGPEQSKETTSRSEKGDNEVVRGGNVPGLLARRAAQSFLDDPPLGRNRTRIARGNSAERTLQELRQMNALLRANLGHSPEARLHPDDVIYDQNPRLDYGDPLTSPPFVHPQRREQIQKPNPSRQGPHERRIASHYDPELQRQWRVENSHHPRLEDRIDDDNGEDDDGADEQDQPPQVHRNRHRRQQQQRRPQPAHDDNGQEDDGGDEDEDCHCRPQRRCRRSPPQQRPPSWSRLNRNDDDDDHDEDDEDDDERARPRTASLPPVSLHPEYANLHPEALEVARSIEEGLARVLAPSFLRRHIDRALATVQSVRRWRPVNERGEDEHDEYEEDDDDDDDMDDDDDPSTRALIRTRNMPAF